MKTLACLTLICGALMAATFATMRTSGAIAPIEGEEASQQAPPPPADGLWARMSAFDKDGDGKLAKPEITDDRLLGLFDRADANKDGSLTKEEVAALETRESALGRGGPGGGGPGGGGPGGPPGGRGRGMGMPRPGEVLPMMFRQNLKLTEDQARQVDALQKDVDSKLAEILTDEQEVEFKQMRERGPGGPGGGPGGPGGPRTKGAPPR